MSAMFNESVLLFTFVIGVAGFVFGAIRNGAVLRGLESAGLAIAGSLIARALVVLLLTLGHPSPGRSIIIGWAFFLWPGAIDSIAWLFKHKLLLTSPSVLPWIASCVGALIGVMDGAYRIHGWPWGIATFLVDVSWGLAGSTNGALLHLANIGWGKHAEDGRSGAHRYASGFRMKTDYAFTQGSVMSDLADAPGSPLWNHERTHVRQNRYFGPFYSLTYIAWLVLWVIPGLIAGAVTGVGVGEGAQRWCYFNCPWEAWGYSVQKASRPSVAGDGRLIWPNIAVVAAAIPFFAGVVSLLLVTFLKLW
jgi:hypothetical protein